MRCEITNYNIVVAQSKEMKSIEFLFIDDFLGGGEAIGVKWLGYSLKMLNFQRRKVHVSAQCKPVFNGTLERNISFLPLFSPKLASLLLSHLLSLLREKGGGGRKEEKEKICWYLLSPLFSLGQSALLCLASIPSVFEEAKTHLKQNQEKTQLYIGAFPRSAL